MMIKSVLVSMAPDRNRYAGQQIDQRSLGSLRGS
jgi:hypothetical protein